MQCWFSADIRAQYTLYLAIFNYFQATAICEASLIKVNGFYRMLEISTTILYQVILLLIYYFNMRLSFLGKYNVFTLQKIFNKCYTFMSLNFPSQREPKNQFICKGKLSLSALHRLFYSLKIRILLMHFMMSYFINCILEGTCLFEQTS